MWTRSLAADGFVTFSMQVDDGSWKYLTADGKHNLTVQGKILIFIHFW